MDYNIRDNIYSNVCIIRYSIYALIDTFNFAEVIQSTSIESQHVDYSRGHSFTTFDRENAINLYAFKLKDKQMLEKSLIFHKALGIEIPADVVTSLQKAIDRIQATNFVLFQTEPSVYSKKARSMTYESGIGRKYTFPVVNYSELGSIQAFVHTPEFGFSSGGNKKYNLANFSKFEVAGDESIICASYIAGKKDASFADDKVYLVLDVDNDAQLVADNHDIWSQARNLEGLMDEYYNEKYTELSNADRVKSRKHRTKVSTDLKNRLFNVDYESLPQEEKLKIDAQYAQRISALKEKLGSKKLSFDLLSEIDPELACVYFHYQNSSDSILQLEHSKRNEVLVRTPKIAAIIVPTINKIEGTRLPFDRAYMEYAQEHNIPIIVRDDSAPSP